MATLVLQPTFAKPNCAEMVFSFCCAQARLAWMVVALAGLSSTQIFAQQPVLFSKVAESSGPAWTTLSKAQKLALLPLETEWSRIDSAPKAKWLEIAARYPTMSSEEQRRMHDRMAEWSRMTPTERSRTRLSFQAAKKIAPDNRQAHWEAYQALPEQERQSLAASVSSSTKAGVGQASPASSALSTDKRPAQAIRSVAPVVVQAKPGATTTLMTRPAAPPAHQAPGQPKIDAVPGSVDRHTLLPKHGPQAAPIRAASASTPRQP